jgi:hypothetical protein
MRSLRVVNDTSSRAEGRDLSGFDVNELDQSEPQDVQTGQRIGRRPSARIVLVEHIVEQRRVDPQRAQDTTLTWRMVFITAGADAASIPFFIEWDRASAHPAQTSPGGCELVSFAVNTPDAYRLAGLLTALGMNTVVRSGESDSLDVRRRCNGIEVDLP